MIHEHFVAHRGDYVEVASPNFIDLLWTDHLSDYFRTTLDTDPAVFCHCNAPRFGITLSQANSAMLLALLSEAMVTRRVHVKHVLGTRDHKVKTVLVCLSFKI